MARSSKPRSSTPAPPPAAGTPATLPYTGKEFLASLDDGREVWIYGERVKNITTHPAFQNCARRTRWPRAPTPGPAAASRRPWVPAVAYQVLAPEAYV